MSDKNDRSSKKSLLLNAQLYEPDDEGDMHSPSLPAAVKHLSSDESNDGHKYGKSGIDYQRNISDEPRLINASDRLSHISSRSRQPQLKNAQAGLDQKELASEATPTPSRPAGSRKRSSQGSADEATASNAAGASSNMVNALQNMFAPIEQAMGPVFAFAQSKTGNESPPNERPDDESSLPRPRTMTPTKPSPRDDDAKSATSRGVLTGRKNHDATSSHDPVGQPRQDDEVTLDDSSRESLLETSLPQSPSISHVRRKPETGLNLKNVEYPYVTMDEAEEKDDHDPGQHTQLSRKSTENNVDEGQPIGDIPNGLAGPSTKVPFRERNQSLRHSQPESNTPKAITPLPRARTFDEADAADGSFSPVSQMVVENSMESMPVRMARIFNDAMDSSQPSAEPTFKPGMKVEVSGLLWKTQRKKTVKGQVDKLFGARDPKHWVKNITNLTSAARRAWRGPKDGEEQCAKLSLKMVELIRVREEENGEWIPYLRWAQTDDDVASINDDSGPMKNNDDSSSTHPMKKDSPRPQPFSLDTVSEKQMKRKKLCGSVTKDCGVDEDGMHVMLVYFPIDEPKSALSYRFLTDNAEEFGAWIDALQEAAKGKKPTEQQLTTGELSGSLSFEISFATNLDVLLAGTQYGAAAAPSPIVPPTSVKTSEQEGINSDAQTPPTETQEMLEEVFCVIRFENLCFRTENVALSEFTQWNFKTDITIARDEPDSCIDIEIRRAPHHSDGKIHLLANTSIPLWFFERQKQTDMCVQLKDPSQLQQRGLVRKQDKKVGLHVRGLFDQPLWSVFRPLDLPEHLTKEPEGLDMTALQETLERVSALVRIYDLTTEKIMYVLTFENTPYSLVWLLYITIWLLFLPQYTVSILIGTLTFYTAKYHWLGQEKKIISLDNPNLGQPPTGSTHHHNQYARSFSAQSSDSKSKEEEQVHPSRAIVEFERRWPFTAFDPQYLLTDIDPAHFSDAVTKIKCGPPKPILVDYKLRGQYHYRWEVKFDKNTDENGWQYAFNNSPSAQWKSVYSPYEAFFRKRMHLGYRMGKVQSEPGEGAHSEEEFSAKTDFRLAQVRLAPNHAERIAPVHEAEGGTTEIGLLKEHRAVYNQVRQGVEITIRLIEKYKNLFSGRIRWVTHSTIVVLALFAIICVFVPINYIVYYLLVDYFNWGRDVGKLRRGNVDEFLKKLREEISKGDDEIYSDKGIIAPHEVALMQWKGDMTLSELKINLLTLRNWIFAAYNIKLDLKTLSNCKNIMQLAKMVTSKSPLFEQVRPRDRAQPMKRAFDNLLDHIPSDSTLFMVNSAAYQEKE